MAIRDLVTRLERLHPDLPTQIRVSTVQEADGAVHPHAQCPRVSDGYDSLVPSRGAHESHPFSRLTYSLMCRFCENSLETPGVISFYAEQFEPVLRAAELLELLSTHGPVPSAALDKVLLELTPSIAVPERAIALALHALSPVLGAASIDRGTLVFAHRADDALVGLLPDAVAHFANGYSLLLLEQTAAESLPASATTAHEPIVVRAGVSIEEATLAAQHVEALLATGISVQAACEAALSLAAV